MSTGFEKGDRVVLTSGRYKGRETTVRHDDGVNAVTVDIRAPFGGRPWWRQGRQSLRPIDAITKLGDIVRG